PVVWTAEHKRRWHVLRSAADLFRRMHEANCYFDVPALALPQHPEHQASGTLRVHLPERGWPTVVLGNVAGLRSHRRGNWSRSVRDLVALRRFLASVGCSATDQMRFLLHYLGTRRLTAAAKQLARLCVSVGVRRSQPSSGTAPGLL